MVLSILNVLRTKMFGLPVSGTLVINDAPVKSPLASESRRQHCSVQDLDKE